MDNKIRYTAKYTHHDLKFQSLVEIGQKMWKLVQTDRPIPTYPPNYVCGGYKYIFNIRQWRSTDYWAYDTLGD
jgi:hypothetical protein